MEREEAAGTNAFGNLAQGLGGVFHEIQNEAAYSSVEKLCWVDRPQIRLPELDVNDSLRLPPFLRDLEGVWVKIDTDDGTLRANQLSHEETHIADAAANVKYLHALTNPSRA
jgi:hypothetical protein